jgi:hypothetical protein
MFEKGETTMADHNAIVNGLLPIIRNVMAVMSLAGETSLFGRMRESKASIDFFRQAAAHFEGNAIIEGVVAAVVEGGEDSLQLSSVDFSRLDLNAVLQQVGSVDRLLVGVDIQEAHEVKEFILGIATSVAGAAGGGLFGSGDKINQTEAQILTSLQAQLGL